MLPTRLPLGTVSLLLAALLLCGLAPPASASTNADTVSTGPDGSTWLQWRGPHRTGESVGPEWPESLEGLELQFRRELGKGYPGPIVSESAVFVAETFDEETEQVRALDRTTGEELWRSSWAGFGKVPFFAKRNGDWIRSTPAFDGDALYVGGMQETILKLDAATGEQLWSVSLPERYGTRAPDFGFVSSPLVEGDAVFVQGANSIVRLDAETGETVWRALDNDGDIMRSGAFSSPVFATLAGVRQLLVQTREELHGLDAETGEVLWKHQVPSFRGMNILTPMAVGDHVFTSTHRNQSFYYGVKKSDDGWEAEQLWTNKAHGYMSSPIVRDGFAYLHLGNGRLTCIALEGGETMWTSEPFGDYWSMVSRGDKILALDSDGELILLRANPEKLEVLDRREIAAQETWGYLAVAGDQIFVRELEGIAAYAWPAGGPAPATVATGAGR